jgi:hypothetical protein
MRTSGKDRGAMRVQSITLLVVVMAIVGVLAYDGVSVMASRVSTETDAQNAAYAASSAWHNHGNVDTAYQAAEAYVAGKNETVLTTNFSVANDGTVTLTLRRTVHTLVFRRIGALKHYGVTLESASSNSIS